VIIIIFFEGKFLVSPASKVFVTQLVKFTCEDANDVRPNKFAQATSVTTLVREVMRSTFAIDWGFPWLLSSSSLLPH
jgi:hypothetical protein